MPKLNPKFNVFFTNNKIFIKIKEFLFIRIIIILFKLFFIVLGTFIFITECLKLYFLLNFLKLLRTNKKTIEKITGFYKKYMHEIIYFTTSFIFNEEFNVVFDNDILESKRNLIISNHITDYDWLYISSLSNQLMIFEDLYIILKATIRKIPILGMLIESIKYLYIERREDRINNISSEELNLKALCNKIGVLKKNSKFSILIFPEGKLLNYNGAYDEVKYDSMFRYVLYPKQDGFNKIIQELGDDYDGIIDITIFTTPRYFPGFQKETRIRNLIFKNDFKFKMNFFVSYIPKNKINPDFLILRFEKKEALLRKYALSNPQGFADSEEFFKFIKNNCYDLDKNNCYDLNKNNFSSFTGCFRNWATLMIFVFSILTSYLLYFGFMSIICFLFTYYEDFIMYFYNLFHNLNFKKLENFM